MHGISTTVRDKFSRFIYPGSTPTIRESPTSSRSGRPTSEDRYEEITRDGSSHGRKGQSPALPQGAQLQDNVQRQPKIDIREGHDECDRKIYDLEVRLEESDRKIESSIKELDTFRGKKIQLKTELMECKDKCEALESDLVKLAQGNKAGQKQFDRLKRNFDEVQDEVARRERDIAVLKEESIQQESETITLKQTLESEIADLKGKYTKACHHYRLKADLAKEQELQINELQQEAEKQRVHITGLTEAISHSSQIATTTRDDDYFSGEFARLFGNIRHWVLRYFDPSKFPEFGHQDFPASILQYLGDLGFGHNSAPDSKIQIGRKEIEAVIARKLSDLIFSSNFTPEISCLSFPTIDDVLGISDHEKLKWRAQTIDIFIKDQNFEGRFTDAVRRATDDIQNIFSSLAKPNTEEPRFKALYSIVEQAAKLDVEIYRQPALLRVLKVNPGEKYTPDLMDDRSGTVDGDDGDGEDEDEDEDNGEDGDSKGKEGGTEEQVDETKEDEVRQRQDMRGRKEFTVGMVLLPPVLRWNFDEEGGILQPGIAVRKAVVIAVHSETGQGDIMAVETEQVKNS